MGKYDTGINKTCIFHDTGITEIIHVFSPKTGIFSDFKARICTNHLLL